MSVVLSYQSAKYWILSLSRRFPMNRIKKSSIVLLHGRSTSIRIININNIVGILGVRVIGDPL